MPKSTKKSPVSAARKAAKKIAKKKPTALKAKATAKGASTSALKARTAAKTSPKKSARTHAPTTHQASGQTHGRGFMWKLLEQKKQQLNKKESVIPGNRDELSNNDPRGHRGGQTGFARFNGPRRKAA